MPSSTNGCLLLIWMFETFSFILYITQSHSTNVKAVPTEIVFAISMRLITFFQECIYTLHLDDDDDCRFQRQVEKEANLLCYTWIYLGHYNLSTWCNNCNVPQMSICSVQFVKCNYYKRKATLRLHLFQHSFLLIKDQQIHVC